MSSRRRTHYEDPRDAAQFATPWAVVVHAHPGKGTTERLRLLKVAEAAFIKDHMWLGYEMVYTEVKGHHVGYRFMNPKDWFLLVEGGHIDDADGPFKSKKLVLRKLGAKTSKKRAPGIYDVPMPEGSGPSWVIFTRDQAEGMLGRRMTV